MRTTNDILEKNIWILLSFILLAYLFSTGVRMYWPLHFADAQSMYYAGELMINTNDGYFFASGARDILNGTESLDGKRVKSLAGGVVALTMYITKFTPFSLETVTLYLPSIISSLIVIPIVLTGRLLGNTLLGFLAALIGSIAWSYYNRTMVGYYDTDMFSVLLQFMIFYSFIKIIYDKTILSTIVAALWVLVYPLFYSQGLTITYAMFIILSIYMVLEYQEKVLASIEAKKVLSGLPPYIFASITLISIALMVSVSVELRAILLVVVSLLLLRSKIEDQYLALLALVAFVGFLYFGNIFVVIWNKVFSYADRGLDSGALHFYQVIQTVREAGAIPFDTMANRISGSVVGVILSVVGYGLLVFRHKAFIVALPLIGVGIFSLVGGLRFTVYAVPVAAISFVYLSFVLGDLLAKNMDEKKEGLIAKYIFVVVATAAMLYPNIKHIEGYLVPTVLNKTEVDDLVKLDKISTNKDYTLTWWDYGYPIWYYSNTNTLIDGGKHTHDNYIISKIMFSTSPQQVANLSKLAVETYVDSNYSIVADKIFKDKNPNTLLRELEKSDYKLPKKTRDVYLYLPFRMMNIFPTVGLFGNLDLQSGKQEKNVRFYSTSVLNKTATKIFFRGGIVFDIPNKTVVIGKNKQKVYRFDQVELGRSYIPRVKSQLMTMDGSICIVFLRSYNKIIIMDRKTYNSTYVQMFMLGKYDKNLFELVVSSPYSKIYRVK